MSLEFFAYGPEALTSGGNAVLISDVRLFLCPDADDTEEGKRLAAQAWAKERWEAGAKQLTYQVWVVAPGHQPELLSVELSEPGFMAK